MYQTAGMTRRRGQRASRLNLLLFHVGLTPKISFTDCSDCFRLFRSVLTGWARVQSHMHTHGPAHLSAGSRIQSIRRHIFCRHHLGVEALKQPVYMEHNVRMPIRNQ